MSLYEGETIGDFRERLRLAGASGSFERAVRDVVETGVRASAAFQHVAPSYGFRRGPIPAEYCVAPSVEELKKLSELVDVRRRQAGGEHQKDAMWSVLAQACRGRRSTPLQDAQWVYDHMLCQVEDLDLDTIPSSGALSLLKHALDDPEKFYSQVFTKILAKSQDKDHDAHVTEAEESSLFSGAVKWAMSQADRIANGQFDEAKVAG